MKIYKAWSIDYMTTIRDLFRTDARYDPIERSTDIILTALSHSMLSLLHYRRHVPLVRKYRSIGLITTSYFMLSQLPVSSLNEPYLQRLELLVAVPCHLRLHTPWLCYRVADRSKYSQINLTRNNFRSIRS